MSKVWKLFNNLYFPYYKSNKRLFSSKKSSEQSRKVFIIHRFIQRVRRLNLQLKKPLKIIFAISIKVAKRVVFQPTPYNFIHWNTPLLSQVYSVRLMTILTATSTSRKYHAEFRNAAGDPTLTGKNVCFILDMINLNFYNV